MNGTFIHLHRTEATSFQTLSRCTVYQDFVPVFSFVALEPPWKNNERNVSCIPCGLYPLVKRESPKYGRHFLVEETPGRSLILIHAGNYRRDSQGCILPGLRLAHLDGDGHLDVSSSLAALSKLNAILPHRSHLLVTSEVPMSV